MTDPYNVLNVSKDASDEEVKKAYRELARKYHPDNYANNPLSDLAQEKMKEINEAYDEINRRRSGRSGSGSSGSAYQSYGNGASSGGGVYARVRSMIASGNIAQAEKLLNETQNKSAEWYFLMGSIAYRKGWLDEAMRDFETACSMDPYNAEYAQALNTMRSGGQAYRTSPYANNMGGASACDCCSSLICADCCCEAMGGDLISCC